MISRRRAVTGSLAGWAVAGTARSQTRAPAGGGPIELLASATPDTIPDRICRAFATFLATELGGAEVSVRNLPGDAGLKVLTALADAPPTGQTVGWVASPTLSARMVDRSADAVMSRLTLVGAIEREPIVFVSPYASPIDSVGEIIRRAAEDAESVPLGTPPAGSPAHLVALRLQLLTQTRLNIVTFPSASAVLQAAVSGNVAAAALGLSDAIGGLRDDKLVGIGIAAHTRAGILPNLPALQEAGVPLSATIRRGLAVPASVPNEVIARLAGALKAISADADFRDYADEAGFLPVWIDGPAWAAQVNQERGELAGLWGTEPWLNSNGG